MITALLFSLPGEVSAEPTQVSTDVFESTVPEYFNGYWFNLYSPEDSIDTVVVDGLRYRIAVDNGNFVAQLVNIGIVSENQVVRVPAKICVNNNEYDVVSVGTCFQPFKITEYNSNQYMYHVGFTSNLDSQSSAVMSHDFENLAEPVHYSLIFEGPVSIEDYAFGEFNLFSHTAHAVAVYTKSGLTSITFGGGVRSIGSWAFAYSCINSIEIPESTIFVGENAFFRTVSMDNVVWHSDCNILESTFDGSSISSIDILGDVESIGERAFATSKLESIVIPDSTNVIGDHCFQQSKYLSSVTLGSGIESIPAGCFSGCTVLRDVIGGEQVKTIGNAAFGNTSLSFFDFNSVETIGSYAFYNAFTLEPAKDIELLHVKVVEDSSFRGCTAVTSVSLCPNLERIGMYAFEGAGLSSITIPDGAIVDKYAFSSSALVSVTFGNHCEIKTLAFYNCVSLNNVLFGEACVLEAGFSGIFEGSGISIISIPESLSVGDGAFKKMPSLKKVVFEGTRSTISANCFSYCEALSEIVFPNGIKSIQSGTFYGCTNLDISQVPLEVTVEDVLSWPSNAFVDTASVKTSPLFDEGIEGAAYFLQLTLVENGSSLQYQFMIDIIGARNCMQLDAPYEFVYVMPDNLAGIYDSAMRKPWTKVSFPNELYQTSDVDGAVYSYDGFTLVKVPFLQTSIMIWETTTSIAPFAASDTELKTVHIPNKVKIIGQSAFYNSKLEIVDFEEGLQCIEGNAFYGTSISEICLPVSLEYVGNAVFKDVDVTIPCDSKLKAIGNVGIWVKNGGSVFIPQGIEQWGDLPFGSDLSVIYLGGPVDSYPSDLLKSSILVEDVGMYTVAVQAHGVSFYALLGTDTSGINFTKLFQSEDSVFGGYYVISSEGPIQVDHSVSIEDITLYVYSSVGCISNLNYVKMSGMDVITLSLGDGWTLDDVVMSVSDGSASLLKPDQPYLLEIKLEDITNGSVLRIDERVVDSTVRVVFDSNGGTVCDDIVIGEGRTVPYSLCPVPSKNRSMFVKWEYADGTEYHPYDPLFSDITLKAVWEDANPRIVFDNNAHMNVCVNGTPTGSDWRVSVADKVVIEWQKTDGYLFEKWIVKTPFETKELSDQIITLVGIVDDTEITLVECYYNMSDSVRYEYSIDFPKDINTMYLQWITEYTQDTSGSMWTGGTGTPLVVNDRMYTYAGGILYMNDLNTGRLLKTADSKDSSGFYHYLGYANGFLFDYQSNKVYDLNLEYVMDSPVRAKKVLWDDTGIYLVSNGIYKYSLDLKHELWSFTGNDGYYGYTSWGVTGGVQMSDGYLYWAGVTSDKTIVFQSIDMDTGTKFHQFELTAFRNYYMDDGWISCYDNTLYLTVYSSGLFGDSSGATGGGIIAISVNDGVFASDYSYYLLADVAHSEFIVHNGRGYVNAGSVFWVFNVNGTELEKVYSYNHGRYTHGGIVLNEIPGSDEVQIMLIPYDPVPFILVFYDEPGQTNISVKTITVNVPMQYNTQAVRFTDDGRIYYYNDAGNAFVLTNTEPNIMFVVFENGLLSCSVYDVTFEEAVNESNIPAVYYRYMTAGGLTPALELDESLTSNYYRYYFSDVPLDSNPWEFMFYSEEYGVMSLSSIMNGHLYLDGSIFTPIVEEEVGYTIRYVDLEGQIICDDVFGKATAGSVVDVKELSKVPIEKYTYKYASTGRFILSPNPEQNILILTYASSVDNPTDFIPTTIIDLKDNTSDVAILEDLNQLSDDGGVVEILLPCGSVTLSNEVIQVLAELGDSASVKIEMIDIDNLSSVQHESVPYGAIIFDISISVGSQYIHELGGQIKVTLPVSLEGDGVKVWYLNNSGELSEVQNVVFSEGQVSFYTNHLSYYLVGVEDEGQISDDGSATISWIIPVSIVVLIVATIVFVCAYRYRR